MPIQHVVVIMQENRSVDNLFHGFPGADTASSGVGHGKTYRLKPLSLATTTDVPHSHIQFLEDYDRGKNDGFDLEFQGFKQSCKDEFNEPNCWKFYGGPYLSRAFSYVPRSEIVPYWTLASQYAFADRMFQSNNGPSYPSHQYMIAGQSFHVADNPGLGPWGCDAPPTATSMLLKYGATKPPVFSPATGLEVGGPFPCFFYPSIAQGLDNQHVTWAYYAPAPGANGGVVWSAFDAIWPVRFGTDWNNDVRSPETRVLSDIASNSLPSVVWITPAFVNSDHAGSNSATGPDWVATIVNAIGQSPYWSSTAIVIMWDDWGGWYDHFVPPQYPNPATHAYEGLGYRVPLIVVSPYAKHGYVSHTQHEVASSLHFIETVFGLSSLGGADARADALLDMFDFTQTPGAFKPIPTTKKAADFLRQRPSFQPPDGD